MSTRQHDTKTLDLEREAALAARIEAGLCAERGLTSPGTWRLSATHAELALVAQQGRSAWSELLTAMLPLVGFLARRESRRSGHRRDELFQQGCVGLIEGLQRFDYRRGVRFSSFAAFWIRAHMSRVNEHGAPTAGAAKRAYRQGRARRAEAELWQQLGRVPTASEIARHAGEAARQWSALPVVVPLHGRDGRDIDVADPRWEAGHTTPESAWHELRDLLSALSPEERVVIEMRFGLGAKRPSTRVAAARTLGLSVGTLRRLEGEALRRLKAAGLARAA